MAVVVGGVAVVVVGGKTACRTAAAAVAVPLRMRLLVLLGGHERTGRVPERNGRGRSNWRSRRQMWMVRAVGAAAAAAAPTAAAMRGRWAQTEASCWRRIAKSCWAQRRGKSRSGQDRRRNQENCQGAADRSWRKRRAHAATPPPCMSRPQQRRRAPTG